VGLLKNKKAGTSLQLKSREFLYLPGFREARTIEINLSVTKHAPEGVLFIPKHESPINKPLVVTSCEGDGTVQVFTLTGEETDL
jgi:hypothetical protein